MTRKHRAAHRIIWPLLALTLALGFAMAVHLRPPVADELAQAAKSR